jgi:hypothetical protein
VKHYAMMVVVFALAVLAAGMPCVRATTAEPGAGVYEACEPSEARVRAADLPRLVDQRRCPLAGRVIVDDGGLGTVLPEPGTGVFAEALTLTGSSQLTVFNARGPTFALEDVGAEASPSASGSQPETFVSRRASSSDGCNDGAHNPTRRTAGRACTTICPGTSTRAARLGACRKASSSSR